MSNQCINCGETLKFGMLSSNEALGEKQLEVVNLVHSPPLQGACNKCGDRLFDEAKNKLKAELAVLRDAIASMLPIVPIVSLQAPHG